MLINYKEQTGLVIDMPRDENIQDKELEKIDKYQRLKVELEQLCGDLSSLGAIADRIPGWLAQILGTRSARLNSRRALS